MGYSARKESPVFTRMMFDQVSIAAVLRRIENGPANADIDAACAREQISVETYYRWRKQFSHLLDRATARAA
jgi:hypothetical protein